MKFVRAPWLILCLLPALLPVLVQASGEPLPPDQAFPVTVTAKDPHTAVFEWNLPDGYYLYHSKFKFASDTPGVTLGSPQIPPGKKKQDEFFGEVEIHRHKLRVELPVQRGAEAGEEVVIKATSQGCADIGICYPPFTQTHTLRLPKLAAAATPAAADDPVQALAKLGGDLGLDQQGDDFLPPDKAFILTTEVGDAQTLVLRWLIADGYYLYRDKFKFDLQELPGVTIADVELPAGKVKEDPYFGRIQVFYHSVEARLRLQGETRGKTLNVHATYQGCADAGLCYPPIKKDLEFTMPKAAAADQQAPVTAPAVQTDIPASKPQGAATPTTQTDPAAQAASPAPQPSTAQPAAPTDVQAQAQAQAAPTQVAANTTVTPAAAPPGSPNTEELTEEEWLDRLFRGGNLLEILFWILAFGLGAAFTACLYPMIPIISSIIVGQGDKATPMRSFILTLVYVEAMAVTFGIVGAFMGGIGGAVIDTGDLQKWWILIPMSILFVLLALSMFGLFTIQMPASIQGKLNELSSRQRGGTFIGVAIMGFLSAAIVGPCGAPIVAATMAGSALSDSIGLGFLYMFTLGNGMGLPLLLVGAGGGKLLPKAGTWMDTVKAVAGVALLAVAMVFFDRAVEYDLLTMLMWASLFIIAAVYLGALEPLPAAANGWRKLWKGFGVVLLVYGAFVMLGGLSGGHYVDDPLQGSKLLGTATADAPATAPAATTGTSTGTAGGTPAYVRFAQGKDAVVKGGLTFIRIKTVADFERELAAANAAGHTVMLDFYADWCTYCKQYDDYVFSNPAVQAALHNTVLLQPDVTAKDAEDKALMEARGVFAPPVIQFFDTQGQEVRSVRVVGLKTADEFLQRVNRAFGK